MALKAIVAILRYFAIFAIGAATGLGAIYLFGFQDEPIALMAMFAAQSGHSLYLIRHDL